MPGSHWTGPIYTETDELVQPTKTSRVFDDDAQFDYFSVYRTGQLFKKNTFPLVGGGVPYVAAQWTVGDGGTGDAIAEATTPGGGLLLTTPSDDDFNISLQSKQIWTPTAGKRVVCLCRMQVSDLDEIGFAIGIGSAQALNFTTDFTDKVMLTKAIATATVTGSVRGNSGTAAASGTLGTLVAATEVQIGFNFIIGASAALSSGSWFYNGTETAFTTAQNTQLFAIMTTPPSLLATLNCTGVTGQNTTITVTSFLLEVEV